MKGCKRANDRASGGVAEVSVCDCALSAWCVVCGGCVWLWLRGPGRRTAMGLVRLKRPSVARAMDGDGDVDDGNQVVVRERDKQRAFGVGWCGTLNERRGSWTETDKIRLERLKREAGGGVKCDDGRGEKGILDLRWE